MADKLMFIPNDDTQNYLFCRFKLVVETFEHSIFLINQSKFTKVSKVVKPTNKKTLLSNLGDCCNIELMFPSLAA